MYIYANYAAADIPPRIALLTSHRGYTGISRENLPLARKLSRSRAGTADLPDTAALSRRSEELTSRL
ncbi:hypothetical protein [Ruminococcus sp.]|uniref:hypothetical protein n=1 Tax=Ruminococcus sp. TaxID=41978 RepID=UPI0025CC69A8|nr:hypothetical protein [Ruminococcus sp.]MBQ8966524.1 hypothetical protein [Ruminococcus sp.]